MRNLKNHFKKNAHNYISGTTFLFSISFFIWLIFISDLFKNFLLWLEVFIQTEPEWVYLVAFLAAIVEGTIILGLLPGTSYIITMGVFWARGDLDPWLLFPVVILGAFLGDILGYLLGVLFSGKIKKIYGDNDSYKLGQKFLKRWGGKAVFLARFLSGIKELVPFLAGCMAMDKKTFLFWNFLGAIGWSILWIVLGFSLGSVITETESIVKSVGLGFLGFFIISSYIVYKKNENKIKNDYLK